MIGTTNNKLLRDHNIQDRDKTNHFRETSIPNTANTKQLQTSHSLPVFLMQFYYLFAVNFVRIFSLHISSLPFAYDIQLRLLIMMIIIIASV